MPKKVLIVGGVAGGASVAARARRLDEHAEVTMFERGPYVSFSNCSLPFYFSGMIENSQDMVLMNPEQFKKQYGINAKVQHEVIKIKPEEKKVVVKDLANAEEFEEAYDALYLSPGAEAILPPSIKGIDSDNVFVVKTVPDVEKIDAYIKANNVQDVTVVGGGYIGLEVMENLKMAGLNVTLVEACDQVLLPYDKDITQIIQKEIIDNDVNLVVNDCITEIHPDKVVTESKKEIKSQMVIMAIGVKPEITLAKDAGIEIGQTGGIKVDANFRTNKKDIYAVGDAIETFCSISHKPTRLPLAGPAQRQARAAVDNFYGRPVNNRGIIGSSCIKLFDLNIANTGFNEKQCQEQGYQYDFVYLIPSDKVGIIPGAEPMHLKLIFEVPTGRILGCQTVGKGNVDKRADVIATMITMNGTLDDLKELELCYSPMFSTAKDPLNHAALVGLNVLNGEFNQVKVSEIREIVENGGFIMDCREPDEFAQGHIKGAHNIPMSEFRDRLDEIPKDEPVYVHCRSGQRSYNTVRALNQMGYDKAYNISGSFLGLSYFEYFEDVTTNREKIVTEYNFN